MAGGVTSSKALVLTLFTPSSDVAAAGWVLWGGRSWGIPFPLQGELHGAEEAHGGEGHGTSGTLILVLFGSLLLDKSLFQKQ